MGVIYIDILLLTNLIINLTLLLLTQKITHSAYSKPRLLVASIIGSLSSLTVLTDSLLASVIVKLVCFVLQLIITFKIISFNLLLKHSLVLLLLNSLYLGLAIGLWIISDRKIFYIKNMTVYFDINTKMLIFLTIVIYLLITLFERLKGTVFDNTKRFTVSFDFEGESYTLDGIADTGNNLNDLYYSKPVVVVQSQKLSQQLSIEIENIRKYNLHLQPYKTVSGEGFLYVTKPSEIKISDCKNSITADVCLGFSGGEIKTEKCIFNPKILL